MIIKSSDLTLRCSWILFQCNYCPVLISAASWRIWSLAIKVQPMVRVPLLAPNLLSSPPAGPQLAALVPALHSLLCPRRCYRSHLLCPCVLFHLPQRQSPRQLHLLLKRCHQPSPQNICRLQPRAEPWLPKNVASFLAGLVPRLQPMLLHQVTLRCHTSCPSTCH